MNKNEFIDAVNAITITEEMQNRILNRALAFSPVRKRRTAGYGIAAACTAAAVGVFSLAQVFEREPQLLKLGADFLGVATEQSESKISLPDTLYINELPEKYERQSHLFALHQEDYIPMSDEEFLDYYGVSLDITSSLPWLKRQEQIPENFNGIYRRESGEVYFDNHSFLFADEEAARRLSVTIAKEHLPFADINTAYDHPLKKSELNGVEMTLAHYTENTGEDVFYAEFLFGGNGYSLFAFDFSQEEFYKVLLSLISDGN